LLREKGDKGREQKDTIRAIGATTLVFSLPILFADLGWLQGLAPLPVLYYLSVYGFERGTGMVAKALGITGILAIFTGTLPAFFFSLTILPLGVILARAGQRQETLFAAAAKGVLLLALAWLLGGWLLGISGQASPYEDIRQNLEEGFAATLAVYEESGRFSEGDLQEMRVLVSGLQRQVLRLLPALLLTSILCIVWFNIVVGQWLLRRRDAGLASWGEFREWRLPDFLVWAVVLAVLALLMPGEALNSMGLNLGFVLLVLYLTQGLAVLTTLMHRWSVPRFFRVMTYAILFLQVYGIAFVSILGLADVWFDIRRQRTGTGTQ